MNNTFGKISALLGLTLSALMGCLVIPFWMQLSPQLVEFPWYLLVLIYLIVTLNVAAIENVYAVIGIVLAQIGGYFMLSIAMGVENAPVIALFWILTLLYVIYLGEEFPKNRAIPAGRGVIIALFEILMGVLIYISKSTIFLWLNILLFAVLAGFYSANSKVSFKSFLKWLFISRSN